MCGITGWLDFNVPWPKEKSQNLIEAMCLAIVHRGPDSWGSWISADGACVLGHRRLAIVDLTPTGYQPMQSHSGRWQISFNGEIYNFSEIRALLEKESQYRWRGTSDTEILLEAVEAWGVEKTLELLDGMFVFAAWDLQKRELWLARDRLGEKPLYYGIFGSTLIFGSELKAIKENPHFNSQISRTAIGLLMRYSYIPVPYTIYSGVNKLPPAHFTKIHASDSNQILMDTKCYWDIAQVAKTRVSNPLSTSFDENVNSLDLLLKASVSERMLADVPLGAFLSGGVDSSLVVALMQAQSSRPVKTFSMGFEFSEYDESPWAKAIAKHLGTDHTEMIVTAKQAMGVIPKLATMYDEPFADSSQIPTFLVSQLARKHVTVSLSGDAGDEFFGGYTRYFMAAGLWNKFGSIPYPMRMGLAQLIDTVPGSFWNACGQVLPQKKAASRPAEKAKKFVKLLKSRQGGEAVLSFVSQWMEPWEMVANTEPEPKYYSLPQGFESWSLEERFMLMDMQHYLTDDILVKVDRAAMAVSLETRVPFLDRDVMEFAWSLPLSHKISEGEGKVILKKLLAKYVPEKLFVRPKMGFGIPLEHWLRGDLRDWAEGLLEPERMRSQGFLNVEMVRKTWERHILGEGEMQHKLWPILMLQAWLESSNEF